MKRSLLATLVIWIGAGWVYYFFLHLRFEPPADWIAAIVGGTIVMLGTGCLRSLRLAYQDKILLQASSQTILPAEKAMVAVTGRITASGTPLKTPFTERDAVLYSYDMYAEKHTTSTDSDGGTTSEVRDETVLCGYEMTPCVIQSMRGNIRLLCFPSLEGFPEERIGSEGYAEKAKQFIARTHFEDMSGAKIVKAFSQVMDLYADDDGTVSKHLRMASNFDLTALNFKEQVVANGEPVCAVGCYHPQKMGLIPDVVAGGGICRLYRGGPEAALKKIGGKITGLLTGAILFLVLGNAALFFILDRYNRAPSQMEQRTDRLNDAISSDDTAKVRELVGYAVDINQQNSSGQTALMNARNGEIARILIAAGAKVDVRDSYDMTALMYAAQTGHADVAGELLKAGADPNVKNKARETALVLARERHSAEAEDVLLKAGAVDDRVTAANGERLTPESAAVQVCFKYIAAIHREDAEGMAVEWENRSTDFFSTVDFSVWKQTRPENPALVEGYQNGHSATVLIDGGPGTLRFEYQLVRAGSEWKIERESLLE